MAVKVNAHITLSNMVDVMATYRYYILQSATLSMPSKPTTYPPASTWDDTEPSYTEGSTDRLYFVDCTVFSNKTSNGNNFSYSEVSLSSSYEAAKAAYNKAVNAQQTAESAQNNIDNLELGGRNLIENSQMLTGNNITNKKISNETYKGFSISTYDNSAATSGYIDFLTFRDIYPEKTGETYTLSFYGKGSGDSKLVTYFNGASGYLGVARVVQSTGRVGTSTDGNSSWTLTDTWTRYWVTFTLANSGNINIEKYILFRLYYGGTANICGVKLEKGNRATDWTPAPEDVSGKISDAQKQLDNLNVYTHFATSVDAGETLAYCDFSGHIEGGTLSNGIEAANDSYIRSSEYLKVIPGQSYIWKVKNSSGGAVTPVTHFYSENSGTYEYLSSQTANTITVPSGTDVFLRFTGAISFETAFESTYELTLSNLDSIITSANIDVYIGTYVCLGTNMSLDVGDYVWELTDTSALKTAGELAEKLNKQLNGTDGSDGALALLHSGINDTNERIDGVINEASKRNGFIVIDNEAPSINLISTGDIKNPGSKVSITDKKISFYNGTHEGAYIGYVDADRAERTSMAVSKTYFTEMYPRVEDSNSTENNKWIGSLCWIARTNGHLSLKVVK